MKRAIWLGLAVVAVLSVTPYSGSQVAAPIPLVDDSSKAFAPLEQWRMAVLAGDAAALKQFYSTNPAAEVEANKGAGDADSDADFWTGLKARKLKLEIVRFRVHPETASIIFNAIAENATGKTVSVADSVVWLKQGNDWRIRYVTRTDAPQLKQPADMKKDLYPGNVDAGTEIKEAEKTAGKDHKRVLLVFGANWCYDCHVLDLAFHRPDFVPVVARYEVVHVDIGDDGKKNGDIAKQFQVPLEKGVPALAVVERTGALVVSQKNGEFENARAMTPEALLEFLNKWKLGAAVGD